MGPRSARAGPPPATLAVPDTDQRGAAAVRRPAAGRIDDRNKCCGAVLEEVNCLGALNVLEAARSSGTRRIIWASSALVFSSNRNGPPAPYPNDGPYYLGNVYGATKVLAEVLLRDLSARFAIESAGLRLGFSNHQSVTSTDLLRVSLTGLVSLISASRDKPKSGSARADRSPRAECGVVYIVGVHVGSVSECVIKVGSSKVRCPSHPGVASKPATFAADS